MAQVVKTNMHRLRERLASEFQDILDGAEVVMVDGKPLEINGKPVVKRPSPAMYNVIRQFLKDNGIDREPLDIPLSTPQAVSSLPFVEDHNEIEGLPAHLRLSDE